MRIDISIVDAYVSGKPSGEYSGHWIYGRVEHGKNLFQETGVHRRAEIELCLRQTLDACRDFNFRNEELICGIFGDTSSVKDSANVLFVVGVPAMYDAMVREMDGALYIIFNIESFADYVAIGHCLKEIISNFLTHELIHVMIDAKYPSGNQSYTEQLDYISFNEGFAHLLSYKENIESFKPNGEYKQRYETARHKLAAALDETDPKLQQELLARANSGRFWDKFGAIASMLYLMKHMDFLKDIFEQGWRGYAGKVANYKWK
ncbi:MAG: hypothetical protein FWB74_00185 [Defluviitaleaceae bacterium]|nr:hypothetical protein [Defluviitaleaceae bacterium]